MGSGERQMRIARRWGGQCRRLAFLLDQRPAADVVAGFNLRGGEVAEGDDVGVAGARRL
ncbi:MAG: hypothetical protein J7M26_08250 [Armatimonadetes bacterium]|nr:hypothetical protein [Armatimonadota bacterium]